MDASTAARSTETESSSTAWYRSMSSVRREHGFEPIRVEGKLPTGLEGTLYRNGPGLLSLFDRPYAHWFDGDGAINAVRFENGTASAAVRVLETPGLREERRRGRPYYGSYGTKAPGFFNPIRALKVALGKGKNPANTSVLAWRDRLLALCEIGRPFEFDSELRSIGPTDLGGAIPRAFSAHPHRIAKTGDVYNIGIEVGRPNAIDVIALRPDGRSELLTQIALDYATLIHDFAATERHLAIFVAPLRLELLSTLLNLRAFDENLAWEPERGTEVIVVPFDAPEAPLRFHVDPFWAWHVANAFERDRTIVMDLVHHPDFQASSRWLRAISRGARYDGPLTGKLSRATIDLDRRAVRIEPWTDRTGELPRVAPSTEAAAHRYVFYTEHSSAEIARNGPADSIARIDTETGRSASFAFASGQKPSEPVFVPRSPAEHDGWLVTLVYDPSAHASYWAIFDAMRFEDGPIATAHLDHHLPPTFHGAWVPKRVAG